MNRKLHLSWLVAVAGSVTFTATVDDAGVHVRVVPKQVVQPADSGPPIVAPQKAVDAAEADAAGPAAETQLRHEDLTAGQRDRLEDQVKRGTTGSDVVPPITLGASFSQQGCRTIPVVNYSGRNGTRPGLGVAHYTVSRNRAGWSDVIGVVNLFNNPRYSASSNYVIDREGHCAYIVPETAKAWTQASLNPYSACSIEMIGDQSENGYVGAGLKKAAYVFRACFKRWGIPVRAGSTAGGCSIRRTGLVDHNELGCGNNHTDIRPYSIAPILRAMGSSSTSCLTAAEARVVHRAAHPKGTGHSARYWKLRSRHRADYLRKLARAHKPAAWKTAHRGCRYQLLAKAAK